jgi:hypothetical protein
MRDGIRYEVGVGIQRRESRVRDFDYLKAEAEPKSRFYISQQISSIPTPSTLDTATATTRFRPSRLVQIDRRAVTTLNGPLIRLMGEQACLVRRPVSGRLTIPRSSTSASRITDLSYVIQLHSTRWTNTLTASWMRNGPQRPTIPTPHDLASHVRPHVLSWCL